MKICILKYALNEIGGAETVAINMANEFSEKFDVHFVSIVSNADVKKFNLSDKVVYKNFLRGKDKIKDTLFSGIKEIRKYVAEEKFDIVFSIGLPTNIFMSSLKFGNDAKLVYCEHGNKYQNPTKLSPLHRYFGVMFADKIVTLTEKDKFNYINSYKNLSEDKVINIPNWIEINSESIEYNSESKRIVTAGRFSKEKGYDLLVEVAKKFLSIKKDWQWDIYGGKDDVIAPYLESKITEYNLTDRLNLKGLSNSKEEMYKDYSVYVLTSKAEGLPLVLLEALSYNLPLVSFDCQTGPSDIISDGKNGYLIDAFDVEKMAEKLVFLAENEDKRLALSQNSRESLEKFEKQVVLRKWEELIYNLKK